MTRKDSFEGTGFSVFEAENFGGNKLVDFLKRECPGVIRDGEIDPSLLALEAGASSGERGYGLSFVGRSLAMARTRRGTDRELKVNGNLSRDFETARNALLKGDNLDCLKLLLPYYEGRIKCVYIDPPYNTGGDGFVYSDRFDRQEAEVLGLRGGGEIERWKGWSSLSKRKGRVTAGSLSCIRV